MVSSNFKLFTTLKIASIIELAIDKHSFFYSKTVHLSALIAHSFIAGITALALISKGTISCKSAFLRSL